MAMTLQATFDGRVFVPDRPVELSVGQKVNVVVTDAPFNGQSASNTTLGQFLDQFADDPASPTDAASQHDHYLYGTPKRENP
jgi:hypothetical protein